MNPYVVKENQTLLDIALQVYGSCDYVVKLCVDNQLSLNDDLRGGTVVLYDVELFKLSPISNKLLLNELYLNTGGELLESTEPAVEQMLEHSEAEHTITEHN
jgi:hypothetical protein